jgi:urease accessory protein
LQLSALRETEELRLQSWQMGRSLLGLCRQLEPDLPDWLTPLLNHWQQNLNQRDNDRINAGVNYGIIFGLIAALWQLHRTTTAFGYLQAWATNLVSAAVRLIPLGQTQGQRTLQALYPQLHRTTQQLLTADRDSLGYGNWSSCGWGLSLASMGHETQYSRLFRS